MREFDQLWMRCGVWRMSYVWLVLPARRPPEESTIPAWRAAGYRVAILREVGLPEIECDLYQSCRVYPGWPQSVSILIRRIAVMSPEAQWFVLTGDDTYPDCVTQPEVIAAQCTEHFGGTFGVMQPTGDQWYDAQGKIIDRICGSPWVGRDFALRMYHGAGPLYPAFFHNHADEHLQCVAQKLGILWQRPDITHYHRHWARPHGATRADMPDWATAHYGQEAWRASSALFNKLKAGGFKEADNLLPILGE